MKCPALPVEFQKQQKNYNFEAKKSVRFKNVTPGYTWVPSKKFSQIGPAVEPATANISENTG